MASVLFVHGIVGNCKIFNFLTPLVPDGCRSHCLVLEGHGGNALEFSKTSMDNWRRQVGDVVDELRRYGPVTIVAHSMGCLLALEQASLGKADGLFLLNPPLRLHIRWRMFENAFKVIAGRCDADPVASAAKDAYGVSIDYNPLHYYGWPSRYLELFGYIHKVQNMVPRLKRQSYAFLSVKDEMVSPKSIAWFDDKPNISATLLPTSHHYYYTSSDRLTIQDCFKDFITQSM